MEGIRTFPCNSCRHCLGAVSYTHLDMLLYEENFEAIGNTIVSAVCEGFGVGYVKDTDEAKNCLLYTSRCV